jgi:hypothetical protein
MRIPRILLPLAAAVVPACNAMQTTGSPDETTFYVASYTRTCTGMYEMQCMLVREDPNGQWLNFYDQIAGFTYEPGYEYVLVVGSREIPNPPQDSSSREYWLVRQVSRTRVP